MRDGRVLPLYSPSVLLSLLALAIFEVVAKIYVPANWANITLKGAIAWCIPLEASRQILDLLACVTSTADLDKISVYSFMKMASISGGLSTMMATEGGAQDSLVTESIGIATTMLAKELPARILHNMVVSSISQIGDGRVSIDTSSGDVFHAKKVVVTIPPPMLKKVTFSPALPADRISIQENTRMGIVCKAFAIFDTPFWREGFGGEILMLDDPACSVFDSSPPGGPGHLCFLITGVSAHKLDALDANGRRDLLLSRLVPFLGRQVLKPADWLEKAWHTDEYCGGGYMAYPLVGTTNSSLPVPHAPTGNIHWAGTESAQEHPGYIEGAIQSGERAAAEVVESLHHS